MGTSRCLGKIWGVQNIFGCTPQTAVASLLWVTFRTTLAPVNPFLFAPIPWCHVTVFDALFLLGQVISAPPCPLSELLSAVLVL